MHIQDEPVGNTATSLYQISLSSSIALVVVAVGVEKKPDLGCGCLSAAQVP
jgi:hypothetical protein